ncbi:hypothetical protein GOODEAATRI_014582, partial [Goodea atripinnis]
EDIAKLLRFESSALPAGQQTNLMEYGSRMKAGTRNIYYLCAPNRHLAEHSPYFEAMKKKDMELRQTSWWITTRRRSLRTASQVGSIFRLSFSRTDRCLCRSCNRALFSAAASERLTQEQADDLMAWMKNALGPRVTNIKLTPRLDTHPAMITVLEMGAARHFLRTQQLARTAEERAQILQPTLEINAG